MRADSLMVSALGAAGVVAAVVIAWRGRLLPVVATRMKGPQSVGDAAMDAVRSLATILSAALVAGFLVVGLGGRLLMRVLGATSGDVAQGRLTEAEEVVGEITLGGTIGFVLFVGLLLPAAASFAYLALRRFLPDPAWLGGLTYGLLLLATFGVADPLSSDNVDFRILTPLPLAVTLVVATALLFGVTFAAIAARLDRSMARINAPGRADKVGYVSLVAVFVPFLLVPSIVYVGARSVVRGRSGQLLERRALQVAARCLLVVAVVAAVAIVARTTSDIL